MHKYNVSSTLQNNRPASLVVPTNAPSLIQSSIYQHFRKLFRGEANYYYPYRNAQGEILGYILRWNIAQRLNGDMKKEIRPFVYCIFPNGKKEWCCQGFSIPRPFFQLDKLTQEQNKPVLICEGEKTALAAQTLFPEFVTTTTMQGAQSAKKSDYSPLKDRQVIIAMDHDDAGLKYGKDICEQCRLAGTSSIQFFNNQVLADYAIQDGTVVKRKQSAELAKGYDLADALMDGWNTEFFMQFVTNEKTPLFVNYQDIFPEINQEISLGNTDIETFKRLASLSGVAYDRLRKTEAKHLKISLATLDKEVEKLRFQPLNSEDVSGIFPHLDPWPTPVTTEELLQELTQLFKRFAILPEHTDTALALWVVFTWVVDSVGVSPILAISSPEKRCGKTTVISILGNLVCKPLLASNISAAALFRTVELWQPTIIIDEADTFIRDSDELRGIINSGHTRHTAYVIRTSGEDHTPKRFSTWGAKAIAIIGSLPDTLHDRSIVIRLRRKLTIEKTEKLRHADSRLFNDLQRKLLRFSKDHATIIQDLRPCFSEQIRISDRALDNWEPLLAIATLAGNTWIEKVHQTAAALSENDQEALPIGAELLKDIERIFQDKSLVKIHTADLINNLCEDEESPWSMYNFRGLDKKITPRQLSRLLIPYQIHSRNIDIYGIQKKGFEKSTFEEAWKRYNILSFTPS